MNSDLQVVLVVSLLVSVGGGEVEYVVVAGAGRPDVEFVFLGGEQSRLLLQRGLRLEEAAHVLLAAPRLHSLFKDQNEVEEDP